LAVATPHVRLSQLHTGELHRYHRAASAEIYSALLNGLLKSTARR
jgi:hypothetical protein